MEVVSGALVPVRMWSSGGIDVDKTVDGRVVRSLKGRQAAFWDGRLGLKLEFSDMCEQFLLVRHSGEVVTDHLIRA